MEQADWPWLRVLSCLSAIYVAISLALLAAFVLLLDSSVPFELVELQAAPSATT